MPVDSKIFGSNKEGRDLSVETSNRSYRDKVRVQSGSVVYTDELNIWEATGRPFINETFGGDLNQSVSFTGNATVIHAGVNSGAALTGTTTGTTASHLIDAGETFSGIEVGMSVKNTTSGTEYALVTAVASNDLTLDNDIFISGENYEINPVWVGTAVAGTWNFADAGKISITSANNNDSAIFENDTNQQWDIDNFSAFSGKIDLDSFNDSQHTIVLSFDLNGVAVGSSVNLEDFIDTSNFSEQSFVVPISNFSFPSNNINGMTIEILRMGGAKPTIKFDDLQWEATTATAPLEYSVTISNDELFVVDSVIFSFADDYTGIATVAGATENHNGHYLAWDQFLGVSGLTNGITFLRQEDNVSKSAGTFRNIADIVQSGGVITNYMSNNTKTYFSVMIDLQHPIRLYGLTNDKIALTINDDMSGLTKFTVLAIGRVEV